MHISKFIDYLRFEKKYSNNTLESYKKDLSEFQEFFEIEIAHSDLTQATPVVLRLYAMKLTERSLSERSINRKISSLKSFYKFLLKTSQITSSPAHGLKSLKQYNDIQLPFSEDELGELLQSTHIFTNDFKGIRDKLIIDLFYQTGIRRNELVKLKTTDIDIHGSKINVIGKRNKQRIIPISQQLIDQLLAYIQQRNSEFQSQEEILFLTEKGKPIYDKLVYNLVNYYLSQVSTKRKKSPHMLRHSFATHMLNQGAELNAVKEILGHSSLSATQVYVHGSIEQLKKVFNQAHPREQQKPKNYDNQITDS